MSNIAPNLAPTYDIVPASHPPGQYNGLGGAGRKNKTDKADMNAQLQSVLGEMDPSDPKRLTQLEKLFAQWEKAQADGMGDRSDAIAINAQLQELLQKIDSDQTKELGRVEKIIDRLEKLLAKWEKRDLDLKPSPENQAIYQEFDLNNLASIRATIQAVGLIDAKSRGAKDAKARFLAEMKDFESIDPLVVSQAQDRLQNDPSFLLHVQYLLRQVLLVSQNGRSGIAASDAGIVNASHGRRNWLSL